MLCENCQEEYTEIYGSGRFCSPKCARGFSTKSKRKEINEKVSKTLIGFKTIPGGKIKVCDYGCKNEAKFQLENGKWCCEDSFDKCPKNIKKIRKKVDKIHYKNHGKKVRKGLIEYYKKQYSKIIENVPFENWPKKLIREYLFKENNNKCQICGFQYSEDENNTDGPFQIHHIDGNNKNWKKENIQLLCLNCHWGTPNFAFRNRKHTEETKKILSIKVNKSPICFHKKYNI